MWGAASLSWEPIHVVEKCKDLVPALLVLSLRPEALQLFGPLKSLVPSSLPGIYMGFI